MLYESHPSKSTRSQGRNEVKVVQVEIALLFPLGSSFPLLDVLVSIDFGVIEDVLRLLLIFVWLLLTSAYFF
mgnify:CR=1 FL=1